MRLRATIEYDGTGYQGWQSQAGHKTTLQETVERALSVAFRQPVRTFAAGRTDAGVHARGQVIAFDVEGEPFPADAVADPVGRAPLDVLLRKTNGLLPADLAMRALAATRRDFDPRHGAVLRCYRYRIWNAPVRSPLEARRAWHVRDRLDDRAMDAAARLLEGEHDFASFQGTDHHPRASVRRVASSRVERAGDVVSYAIEANAFVRHMVRNIIAELVAIGRGRRAPESIAQLLAARDRRLAAATAPAQGLVLEWVRYPEEP